MVKLKPNVKRGGKATNIGGNFYYMSGRKHSNGGIDIGKTLEVEDGEVVQTSKNGIKVYSAQPILNGVSPAKLVMGGVNPDKVFNAQEQFKAVNGLNDDGTIKHSFTGEQKKAELGTKIPPIRELHRRLSKDPRFAYYYKNMRFHGGGSGGGGGAGIKFNIAEPEKEFKTVKDTIYVPVVEDFNTAFGKAVKRGDSTFVFNDKLYNTKINNNPKNVEAGRLRTQITDILPVEIKKQIEVEKQKDLKAMGGLRKKYPYLAGDYYGRQEAKTIKKLRSLRNDANYQGKYNIPARASLSMLNTYKDLDDVKSKPSVVTNIENAKKAQNIIAQQNIDKLSFGKAFRQAYNAKVKEFTWRGKQYTTKMRNSVPVNNTSRQANYNKRIALKRGNIIPTTDNERRIVLNQSTVQRDSAIANTEEFKKQFQKAKNVIASKDIAAIDSMRNRTFTPYEINPNTSKVENVYNKHKHNIYQNQVRQLIDLAYKDGRLDSKKIGGIVTINGNVKNGLIANLEPNVKKAALGTNEKRPYPYDSFLDVLDKDPVLRGFYKYPNKKENSTTVENSKIEYITEKPKTNNYENVKTNNLEEVPQENSKVVETPKMSENAKQTQPNPTPRRRVVKKKSSAPATPVTVATPTTATTTETKVNTPQQTKSTPIWDIANNIAKGLKFNLNTPTSTTPVTTSPTTTTSTNTTTSTTPTRPVKIDTGTNEKSPKGFFDNVTKEDWISLGSNLAGTIGTGIIGLTQPKIKLSAPEKPIMAQAQRLKTTYNNRPEISAIRESAARTTQDIHANTASSRAALQRLQRVRNAEVAGINQSEANRENIETKLINADRLNRQEVSLRNVEKMNEYLKNLKDYRDAQSAIDVAHKNDKLQTGVNMLSGINASMQDLIGRIENRKKFNRNLAYIYAANPNVNLNILRDLGVKFDN